MYTIAEIAQAHDGSLGILHSYIDALAETGVTAVKFQMHFAEAESSPFEPFRVKFSYADRTRFDYWKRMEFSKSQWQEIKAHCEEKDLDFVCSPFSIAAVELLEELDVKVYKIASGEITNNLMLDRVARTGKPVILSSGMSSLADLDAAHEKFSKAGVDIAILQCTTMYPTPPEEVGLNVLTVLKDRFKCRVGLSDHSGKIFPALGAVMLGAEVLEFHAVFDRRMFGPDAKASLTIDEISSLVEGIQYLEKTLQNPVNKEEAGKFEETKRIFGKSLAVNKNLEAGHTLVVEDLESKKPAGYGIPAAEYSSVLNKRVKRSLEKNSFLNYSDLE